MDARLHRAVLSRRPLSWRHRCRSAQVRIAAQAKEVELEAMAEQRTKAEE